MRLDTFKNTSVKDEKELAALLQSKGIERDSDRPKNIVVLRDNENKKKNNKKEDPSLRSQMLRWYNANSDMLALAVNNVLRIVSESTRDYTVFNYAAELRALDNSLSNQPENLEVDDICLLENYLFINYPIMEVLSRLTRPEGIRPKHLVTEDIDNIDIFKLTNALVEESRKEKSPFKKYNYVDFLDVLTC